MKREQGFTLIEVLVALAIMALAFAALLRASGLAAENSAILRERMLAGWVAENQMARLQLQDRLPAPGIKQGVLVEDDRRWRWEQEVTLAQDPKLLRVEVRILAPGEARYQLAVLTRYLMRRGAS